MSVPHFKRVEPFNPTQISNCCLWLDASDTTTLTLSGTNVTQWRDKSGSNNHGTGVGAGGTYPTYSNGTMNFVHASQKCFTLPNGAFPSGNASAGYFVVFTNNDASVGNNANALVDGTGLLGGGQPDGSWDGWEMWSRATQRLYWGLWSAALATPYTTLNSNAIFSTQYNNNGGGANGIGTMVVNGTIVGTGTGWGPRTQTNNNNYVGSMYRGSQYAHSGTISEVIVYSNALTTAQQQQVEGYLAQKWQFKTVLPGGHAGQTGIIYPSVRRTGTVTTATSTLPYYTQFSPLSIAGCALWLDASDATSYTNTGGVITSWKDKVATITTTAAKGSGPSLSNINGLNALYFNAGANIMLVNVTQSMTNRTFFMVLTSIVNSGAYIWPSSGNGLEIQGRNATELSFADQNTANIKFSPSFSSLGTQYIASIAYAGATNTQFYINGSGTGTDGGQTTSSTLSSDNTHYIGGNLVGYAASFILGEIIEYNVTLGTTQRQQIESYLAQKWGVTLAVAPTIPAGTLPLVTNLIGTPHSSLLPKPIVIATGGTIVTANGYRTHTFTTVGSASFVLTSTPPGRSFQVLIVSGGGAGGGNVGGGGGAGGAQLLSLTLTAGTYSVTVGNGGAIDSGTGQGQNGGSSTFNATTIVGGGAGAVYNTTAGAAGACGGGASTGRTFGTGSVGFNGGSATGTSGGGGGGMGSVGSNGGGGGYNGGAGGAGATYTIGGVSYTVCGGGGGGGYGIYGGVGGSGGSGGGANGSTIDNIADGIAAATPNSGGGGGGGTNNGNDQATAGASGIVIVSYVYP